jgi:hypothetical protein
LFRILTKQRPLSGGISAGSAVEEWCTINHILITIFLAISHPRHTFIWSSSTAVEIFRIIATLRLLYYTVLYRTSDRHLSAKFSDNFCG